MSVDSSSTSRKPTAIRNKRRRQVCSFRKEGLERRRRIRIWHTTTRHKCINISNMFGFADVLGKLIGWSSFSIAYHSPIRTSFTSLHRHILRVTTELAGCCCWHVQDIFHGRANEITTKWDYVHDKVWILECFVFLGCSAFVRAMTDDNKRTKQNQQELRLVSLGWSDLKPLQARPDRRCHSRWASSFSV